MTTDFQINSNEYSNTVLKKSFTKAVSHITDSSADEDILKLIASECIGVDYLSNGEITVISVTEGWKRTSAYITSNLPHGERVYEAHRAIAYQKKLNKEILDEQQRQKGILSREKYPTLYFIKDRIEHGTIFALSSFFSLLERLTFSTASALLIPIRLNGIILEKINKRLRR